MSSPHDTIDQIADRAERLLVRHDELQRTNNLLASELKQVRSERDLLRSRLDTANERLDQLIAQLPPASDASSPAEREGGAA